MAEISLVKGDTSALDRIWMSMPDGSARQVAVHVVHDLPHLVVESLFGIDDGLWGVLWPRAGSPPPTGPYPQPRPAGAPGHRRAARRTRGQELGRARRRGDSGAGAAQPAPAQ